jgi:hypothetical protein
MKAGYAHSQPREIRHLPDLTDGVGEIVETQ